MKVIVQQAVAGQPHGHVVVRFAHQSDKRREVIRLMKDIVPAIPTIQRVIDVLLVLGIVAPPDRESVQRGLAPSPIKVMHRVPASRLGACPL